ncbi:acyl-CoA dehydrogenase family protein [Pseudonocardia nigra]|uniref:acyl-CoA dehydrogenase family protein n=1 Tax=Pseudonocardia nigra TaxID=1921578 RepID=UPI001C5E3CA4|nr:acyl-CoA dehydrogenase family protein [Pseudonocardia nigra]
MRIALTAEQEQLHDELREYFAKLMTPDIKQALASSDEGDHGNPGVYKKVLRQIGSDGWLGIGWPKEYGGQGRSTLDQLIFSDEADVAGMGPIPWLALSAVGPTIMAYGTEEQKKRFLPRIVNGEVIVSIGYSEPDAGTDLAMLKTRAVRDGDDYVINGQKMWVTFAEYADYLWLAARTDPDAQRHNGISVFLVPTDTPGLRWSRVNTMGERTTVAYFDDARVPAENLVGGENQGWRLVTNQLNHERAMIGSPAELQSLLRRVVQWAADKRLPDGTRVIDQQWVRMNLARIHAGAEFLKLITWEIATSEAVNPAKSSVAKVYASEFTVEAHRLAMEVLGAGAVIQEDSVGAELRGHLEFTYRLALVRTFGGGTNEIQRDIIVTAALGMPRAPR